MTIGAATERTLGELHLAIAERLKVHVDDLQSDPRYVQMAIKFCNDNNITVVPAENTASGQLGEALSKRQRRVFKDTNITEMSTAVAEKIAREG